MDMVKLLDVVEIKNQSVKEYGGEKKYVATGDLDIDKIVSYTKVSYEQRPSRANIEVLNDQVIFARMKNTKKILKINEENKDYIFSTGFCVLEPTKKILPEYLEIVIKSDLFQKQKDKYSKGATQKAINNAGLKKITIPLLSLETQKKIVEVLDKSQALIAARKEQIRFLDDYIQSIFYDMFGDPVRNPKGWVVKRIGNVYEVKTGATPSRRNNEFWDNASIPWVKTNEVVFDTIYNTNEKISLVGLEKTSLTLFPVNTLLIAMYGQGKTRGRVAKLGIEATTNQACAALLPINKINADFMFNYLKLSYEELRKLGRGGNQPNLNLDLVRNFNIIIPPQELQNQFANIVQKIEAQKQLMEKSLVEMENNFNSLMQRAFKGELFS